MLVPARPHDDHLIVVQHTYNQRASASFSQLPPLAYHTNYPICRTNKENC